MTLSYNDLIPPEGIEDHIEYAIKRVNTSVLSKMITTEEDVRIESMKAIGEMLYMQVRRPVNPYTPVEELDDNDPTQWTVIPRCHRRFSLQEIFDDRVDEPLAVSAYTEEAVLAALENIAINLTGEVEIYFVGSIAHFTATNSNSFLCWGKGKLDLAPIAVEEL